jgi:DNA-binding phage protein
MAARTRRSCRGESSNGAGAGGARKRQQEDIHQAIDFRETIRERAQREPQFRKALLREAIELMLSGDEKTGRAILRNYINATVGFRQLEEATSIPANSLMRMFGPNGNPSARNLFGVLAHLQAQEGVNFEIRPRRA